MRDNLTPLRFNDLLSRARVERAEPFSAVKSARPHARILQPQPGSRRARWWPLRRRLQRRPFASLLKAARDNVRVDAAGRIQSSIAGPIILRKALPPLASNDLLGRG